MKDLTLHETAKILSMSYQTLFNLVTKGQFPAYKVGGRWRVNPAELEKVRAGHYTPPPIHSKEKGKKIWRSKNVANITMCDSNLREKKYTEALELRPKQKLSNLKLISKNNYGTDTI